MKKALIFLFVALTLVSFASAVRWDNIAYWGFNEGQGTYANDSLGIYNTTIINNWTVGIIGNATYLNRTNYLVETGAKASGNGFTLNFWVNRTTVNLYDMIIRQTIPGTPTNNGDYRVHWQSDGNLTLDIRDYLGRKDIRSGVIPYGRWAMITLKVNGTSAEWYVNGTKITASAITNFVQNTTTNLTLFADAGGSSPAANISFDELGYWRRTLSNSEITQLYNSGAGLPFEKDTLNVELYSPLSDTSTMNSTLDFYSGNFNRTYSIKNATLYIWNNDGSIFRNVTNTTFLIYNNTHFSVGSFSIGEYSWNVYLCGTNSTGTKCVFSDTNKSLDWGYSTLSTLYSQTSTETSREMLQINISTNSSVTSVSAYLVYGGNSYSSEILNPTTSNYSLLNNIDIPLASQDNQIKNLYWIIKLTSGGVDHYFNTTINSQVVSSITFGICSGENNISYINFSSKSAQNPFPTLNATFKSAWNIWTGEGTIKKNVSYEDINENVSSFAFCAKPYHNIYTVDADLEYDGTGYSKNYYFISEANITNSTTQIPIYMLNESLSTLTVLRVFDSSQSAEEGVTIQIQLYDIGTDTFYLVGMAKTDYNGEDISYLNWYDTLYRFILIKDGSVIKSTNTTKISATPKIFNLDDTLSLDFQKFRDFQYSLSFNNVTNNFVLTFTKPSGLVDQGCLRVIKRTASADTQICYICESSTSATLYCNINSYGNGTYIAHFYATGSLYDLQFITHKIGEGFSSGIYDLLGNEDATFYAFLFSGIVMAMFFVHPVFGIIGAILGILGAAALGFTQVEYATFIGIVLIGGVIVWIIKR